MFCYHVVVALFALHLKHSLSMLSWQIQSHTQFMHGTCKARQALSIREKSFKCQRQSLVCELNFPSYSYTWWSSVVWLELENQHLALKSRTIQVNIPISGRDKGQGLQIRDCPGSSGTVGTYVWCCPSCVACGCSTVPLNRVKLSHRCTVRYTIQPETVVLF